MAGCDKRVRVTPDGSSSQEFKKRCDAAWRKFHELWPLLRRRDSSLKKRLKLFDASVSKSMLWCSATWTLTAKEKRHLRAVQRNMLRRFVGPRRSPEEDWITWVQRATHIAEKRARTAGIECWLSAHLFAKWQWASRVSHMPEERCARLTFWRDSAWWVGQVRGTDHLLMACTPSESMAITPCDGKMKCVGSAKKQDSVLGRTLPNKTIYGLVLGSSSAKHY